jgi:hypothetical protein
MREVRQARVTMRRNGRSTRTKYDLAVRWVLARTDEPGWTSRQDESAAGVQNALRTRSGRFVRAAPPGGWGLGWWRLRNPLM